MNDTKKTNGEQNIPQTFTLAELEEKILSAKTDLYLQLRKSVIGTFAEYAKLQKIDMSSLLSNMLLDMDEVFKTD